MLIRLTIKFLPQYLTPNYRKSQLDMGNGFTAYVLVGKTSEELVTKWNEVNPEDQVVITSKLRSTKQPAEIIWQAVLFTVEISHEFASIDSSIFFRNLRLVYIVPIILF